MADAQRTQVNTLVLHHAVTPLWEDKSKAWLAQWFSDNGFARGYGSNPANWSGLVNPYTGARSYAQAQYAGQRVTSATPDATAAERAAGYRLVQLVKDPFGQICWHAGNYSVNQGSIGIENLGDYRNYTLRDGDNKVIANFWRAQDKKLNGKTWILGHLEVNGASTVCPARIMEQRDRIVALVNTNPAPTPAPTPTPTPKPSISIKEVALKTIVVTKTGGAELWDLNFAKYADAKSVKHFNKGDRIDVTAIATHPLGGKYYMTQYSVDKKIMNGINVADVSDYTAPKPVVTTKDVTRTEKIDYGVNKTNDNTIPKGEERIIKVGIPGEKTITTRITYTDGVETKREDVQSTVTEQPINQEVHVGTYVAPTPPSRDDEQDAKINGIMALFEAIGKAIQAFLDKFKK